MTDSFDYPFLSFISLTSNNPFYKFPIYFHSLKINRRKEMEIVERNKIIEYESLLDKRIILPNFENLGSNTKVEARAQPCRRVDRAVATPETSSSFRSFLIPFQQEFSPLLSATRLRLSFLFFYPSNDVSASSGEANDDQHDLARVEIRTNVRFSIVQLKRLVNLL